MPTPSSRQCGSSSRHLMDDRSRLRELERFGQSVWIDWLTRDLLTSGAIRRLDGGDPAADRVACASGCGVSPGRRDADAA